MIRYALPLLALGLAAPLAAQDTETGFRTPKADFRNPETGFRKRETGFRKPVAGYRFPDTGFGNWFPETGFQNPHNTISEQTFENHPTSSFSKIVVKAH